MRREIISSHPSPAAQQGFSLLEMLVVLAVMGLLFSAALPGFARMARDTPVSIGSRVLVMLQTARLAALTGGAPATVTFDAGTRQIHTTSGGPTIRVPDTISFTLAFGSELSGSASEGNIVFLGQGNSSGGEVRFSDGSGAVAVVSVNWLTGRASLRETQKP